jgi:hypothetical protein
MANSKLFYFRQEIKNQFSTSLLTIPNGLLANVLPELQTYISILVFIGFSDKPLLPEYIVLTIAYYTLLSNLIGLELMKGIANYTDLKVSLKRVQVRQAFDLSSSNLV